MLIKTKIDEFEKNFPFYISGDNDIAIYNTDLMNRMKDWLTKAFEEIRQETIKQTRKECLEILDKAFSKKL